MFKSKKINTASVIITITALVIGFLALIWNIILDNHTWNHPIFRQNHYTDGIVGPLCIAFISLIVFRSLFCFVKRNLKNKVCKVLSYFSYFLYNIAAIALIIIVFCTSLDVGRDYKDYRLDCQLASDDNVKVHEAVDSVIARSHNYDLYGMPEVNDYMMKAARNGYAPAQNYVGVFFHEKAKEENDRYFGHGKWNLTETSFCQENLNRATYWWLKAANQNHGIAQENLGLLKMQSILSNQPYSFGEAKYWFTEATKNGIVSAYYHLGLLYRDSSLSEAAQYWRIGAEKGDEDCNRMLENPDFIDVTVTHYNR